MLNQAVAPYSAIRRTPLVTALQFWRVVRVMLAEYRETWYIHAIFGLLFPIGMIFMMRAIIGEIGPSQAIYLVGGNMTMSVAYGPTAIIIGRLGWGKQFRTFEYWAALPVSKTSVIVAMMTVALALATPGILGVYVIASLMLGVPLAGGLALIWLVPLSALSVCGLGAFIGAYSKDGQTANIMSNAFIGFTTFLSPLMIPIEEIPTVLRYTAVVMPTTYAAEAFRSVLRGDFGLPLLLNAAALAAFAVIFLWLVHRKFDWRSV